MKYPEPYKRNDSKYYFFIYTDPKTGKRKRKSTGETAKREAREYIQKTMNDLYKGIVGDTFREYAEPFFNGEDCPHLLRRRDENKTIGGKHIKNSRKWLEMHVLNDPEFSRMKMSNIKRGDILALRERIRKKTSESVVNKTMSAVKVIFTEAYYKQDIDMNPGSQIGSIKYKKKVKGFLTVDEIKELFRLRPGYWKYDYCYDLFFVVVQTGMRCGEILALDWNHVDLDNAVIEVHRAWKQEPPDTIGLPKHDKKREFPVTGKVIDVLKRYPGEKDRLVFCYPDGSRYGETWWKKRFRYAMEQAGIDYEKRNITPHCLRHSLNTNLLSAECNEILTQAYLGWSSKYGHLTMVQKGYTHLTAIHLQDIADTIDRLYNDASPLKLVKKAIT